LFCRYPTLHLSATICTRRKSTNNQQQLNKDNKHFQFIFFHHPYITLSIIFIHKSFFFPFSHSSIPLSIFNILHFTLCFNKINLQGYPTYFYRIILQDSTGSTYRSFLQIMTSIQGSRPTSTIQLLISTTPQASPTISTSDTTIGTTKSHFYRILCIL
jgi:hypothetical protein